MLETAQPTPHRKRLVTVTGVQRSGTTAVFEALAKSPGVTPITFLGRKRNQ